MVAGVLLTAAAMLAWIAFGRMRADARRFANAAWIIAASLTAMVGLASIGFGLPLSALFLLVVFAPLLGSILAALLVYNGAVMLRREGHSLANLLSLIAGVVLAIAIITGIALLLWNLEFVPLALWIALSCLWVATLFFAFIGYGALYQLTVTKQPAYLVVLGCGLIGTQVSPLLRSRIDRALQLRQTFAAQGEAPIVVMSGGQGPDEPISEAAAMCNYALSQGLPPGDLLVEQRSRTTAENLRYSAAVIRAHLRLGDAAPLPPGIAVTSSYHVLRTAMLARGLALPIDALGAATAGYFWPSATLREFVAVVQGSWRYHLASYLIVTGIPTILIAVGIS